MPSICSQRLLVKASIQPASVSFFSTGTLRLQNEDFSAAPKSVYVGQLAFEVDNERLEQEFSEFGEIVSVRIITDRDSGRSKG